MYPIFQIAPWKNSAEQAKFEYVTEGKFRIYPHRFIPSKIPAHWKKIAVQNIQTLRLWYYFDKGNNNWLEELDRDIKAGLFKALN
jgi:hypothetical protein